MSSFEFGSSRHTTGSGLGSTGSPSTAAPRTNTGLFGPFSTSSSSTPAPRAASASTPSLFGSPSTPASAANNSRQPTTSLFAFAPSTHSPPANTSSHNTPNTLFGSSTPVSRPATTSSTGSTLPSTAAASSATLAPSRPTTGLVANNGAVTSPPSDPRSVSSFNLGPTATLIPLSSLVPKKNPHTDAILQTLSKLFNNDMYSDATIQIHSIRLPVHKSVICTQSEYFEKAFQKNFAEGASGIISFTEGSGAAYWRVFEYLYKGDYSRDLPAGDFEDDAVLLRDPRVYALADMFLLKDLKVLSQTKLHEKLKNIIDLELFPNCVREVYASTQESDSDIRSMILGTAKTHARELNKRDSFKELLQEGGDFAVEYVSILTNMIRTT